MRPTRLLALALAVLLFAAPVAPVMAQTTFPIIGPGGMVTFSTASTACVNTTTACTIFTYIVPPGLYATSPNTNVSPAVLTPPPLHLTLRGTLSTPSGGQIGTINLGANFGGTTATIAMLNAHTPVPPGALSLVPIQLDVWMAPLATAIGANTVTLSGRVAYVATGGTETVVNSYVIGTTTLNVANTLAVNWLWSSASNTNSVTFHNETLQIGN